MPNSPFQAPWILEFDQWVNSTNRPSRSPVCVSRNTQLNFRVDSEESSAVAEIEVPGVDPSDVKVRIEGRSLSVETPKGNAYITIGQRLDADGAVANLKHGLLTIRIPKRDARVVEVKVQGE